MAKVTIEADEVRCAVTIRAEPGDILLVMNGLCVGVHQRSIIRLHAAARERMNSGSEAPGTRAQALQTVTAIAREVAHHEPVHVKGIANKFSDLDREDQDKVLMAAIRERQPIRTAELLDLLKINDVELRGIIRSRVNHWAKTGKIVRPKGEVGKRMHPHWTLKA